MKRNLTTICAAWTMLLAAMATGCSQEQPQDTGGITVCIGTDVQTRSAVGNDDYYTNDVQEKATDPGFYYRNGFSAAAYSVATGALLRTGSTTTGNQLKLQRTTEEARIVAAGNAPDFAWPDNIDGLADVQVPINVLDGSTVVCINDIKAVLNENSNYYVPSTGDKTINIDIAFSPVSAIVLKNGSNGRFNASSIRVTSAAKYVKPFANDATAQTASGSADSDALDHASISTSETVTEGEDSDTYKFDHDGLVLYIPKGGPATIEVKGTTAENGKIYDETYTISVPAYTASDGKGNVSGAETDKGQAYQWTMTPDFDRQDRQYTMTADNASENVTVVVGMQDYRSLSLKGVTAYGNGNPFQAKANASTTNKDAGSWTYTVAWEGNSALAGNTTVQIDGTSYDLGTDGSATITVNAERDIQTNLIITSSYSGDAEQTVDFVCSDPGASCTVTVLQDPDVAVKPVKIQPNMLADDQWVLGGGSSTSSFSLTVTYSDGSTKTIDGAEALALIDNSDGYWTISGSTLKAKDATTSAEMSIFYSEKGTSLSFSSVGGIVKDSDMFSVVNANTKVIKDYSSTTSMPEVISIKTYSNNSIALLYDMVKYSCSNSNLQATTDKSGRTTGYKLKGSITVNGSLGYSVTGTYTDEFNVARKKTVYQTSTVYQRRYRYYKVEMDGNSAHQHQSDEREENYYTVYVTFYDSINGEKSIASSYIQASYDQDGDLQQETFDYTFAGTKVQCQTFDTVTRYFECDPDGNALATGYVTENGKYYYYVPFQDLTDEEIK